VCARRPHWRCQRRHLHRDVALSHRRLGALPHDQQIHVLQQHHQAPLQPVVPVHRHRWTLGAPKGHSMSNTEKTWHWRQPPSNPKNDPVEVGVIALVEEGLRVVPEDDYYYGHLSREEALELARAIIEKFGA